MLTAVLVFAVLSAASTPAADATFVAHVRNPGFCSTVEPPCKPVIQLQCPEACTKGGPGPGPGPKVGPGPSPGPKVYAGFKEHAYRLVFPIQEQFATQAPYLLTVLPSGVVETVKILEAHEDLGIIAYPYPQNISYPWGIPADIPYAVPDGAVKAITKNFDKGKLSKEQMLEMISNVEKAVRPFVWRRPDTESFAVVQTWPTTYNPRFQVDFEISDTNPDHSIYSEQAVAEFRQTCAALFKDFDASKHKIKYCHRPALNEKTVYVDTGANLIAYLRAKPGVVQELNIAEVTDFGFVANWVTKKEKYGHNKENGTKVFDMQGDVVYALYTKVGWEEMASVTPLEQFRRDRNLIEDKAELPEARAELLEAREIRKAEVRKAKEIREAELKAEAIRDSKLEEIHAAGA